MERENAQTESGTVLFFAIFFLKGKVCVSLRFQKWILSIMFKDKTIVYTSGIIRYVPLQPSSDDKLCPQPCGYFDCRGEYGMNWYLLIGEADHSFYRASANYRSIEDSRYCHSTTYVGSFRNSQKAEYRRFCCGGRLVWQV